MRPSGPERSVALPSGRARREGERCLPAEWWRVWMAGTTDCRDRLRVSQAPLGKEWRDPRRLQSKFWKGCTKAIG